MQGKQISAHHIPITIDQGRIVRFSRGIFDQNDLDYVQTPEALFITDTTDLIAIGSDDSFQILTQTELAGAAF